MRVSLFAGLLLIAGCAPIESPSAPSRAVSVPVGCPVVYVIEVDGARYLVTSAGGICPHQVKAEK